MSFHTSLQLPSPAHTHAAGVALGQLLAQALEEERSKNAPSPRLLCLCFGEMGAGKTTFIKALCEGMGLPPQLVISPTYTLVNIYPGRHCVYHVDFFRLESGEALLDLDENDWLNPAGLTAIEWPEAALPLLRGERALELHLELGEAGAQSRHLRLSDREALGEELLGAWSARMASLLLLE